jgi:hypothetical protein
MNRRGFGHIFGRLFRRASGANPQISPALQRANRLMAAGDYPGAAADFEELARRAESRDGTHAPFFYLQAGRARLLTGEYARAVTHFKHGLTLLANARRYNQLYRAGTRIIQELKARALEKEAREISGLIHGHTPAIAEMETQRLPKEKPLLPTHCPACGAPIRSDEAEWVDEGTVECPFCGSPVRARQ